MNFPKLQYFSDKFDDIFNKMIITIDLILFLQSKVVLNFNHGTKKVLMGFLANKDKLNEIYPLFTSLISNLDNS
jgi:hypothetical protein